MKKRSLLLLLPTVLIPYAAIFSLIIVFFSSDYVVFEFIMEKVFQGDGLLLLFSLLLFYLIAVSLSVIFFILSYFKKYDALKLAKCALVIKLIQVPAYIVIYVLGIILFITIFTFAFSIVLFLVDCLTLALTGFITVFSAINAMRSGIMKTQNIIWIIILQFVFCADVVASFIYYKKLKKLYIDIENSVDNSNSFKTV